MNDYDAVIFDQDGVLLDSGLNNFLWMDKARKNAADELGINLTTQDSIKIVESSSKEDVKEVLEGKSMSWNDLKIIERSVAERKIEMIKNGYIRLFPEARRVLENLNVPVGLATNASSVSTEFVLDFFSLNQYFDSVRNVELEEGRWFECKKPGSTLVDGIKNDLQAENPLMIGDTSSDIGAAHAAGIDSVLIESYSQKPELNPTHRVKTISELDRIA